MKSALKQELYDECADISLKKTKILAPVNPKHALKIESGNEYKHYPNIDINRPTFISVVVMDNENPNESKTQNDNFIKHLKIGIIKDLYAKQLITENQMDKAVAMLNQKESAKC